MCNIKSCVCKQSNKSQNMLNKETIDILKHLTLVATSIEQICDDILCFKLRMGRVMNFRFLYLDLYLWCGYLSRLLNTELNSFAKQLLKDFSQKICTDKDKIVHFRNLATHYSKNCEMDIMLTVKNNDLYPTSDLPSYKNIKDIFKYWEAQIVSKMASDVNDND